MYKLIINADDCGQSINTNKQIEDFILKGKITSCTIMANRDDLDGAVNLYKRYSDTISFGVHLNIDSGRPILYSQPLIDFGFIKIENDGSMAFQKMGKQFRHKKLPKVLRKDIYDELKAQINVLRDNNIQISHIDSHHSVHLGLGLMPLMPQLISETGLFKIRRRPNMGYSFKQKAASLMWNCYQRFKNKNLCTTDFFGSVHDFMEAVNNNNLKEGCYEIMIHPGIDEGVYQEENNFIKTFCFDNSFSLMNFNQL